MLCRKVTMVGVGLLGGSLGMALRLRHLAARVEGYVRRAGSIAECEKLGAVDRATTDLGSAVRDADLVVLCTPVGQMRELTEQILPALKPGAVVTDVGSVKSKVVTACEPLVQSVGAHFVGSHPMAGAEKMGVGHSRPDLFQNATCVVTPSRKCAAEAIKLVRELWKGVGGKVLKLTPELHDELVSRSSHLPHVIASELAQYVLSPAHCKEQAFLCANGFRDTTRVASSSPEMWRDIVLANREHLSRVLGVFVEGLEEFRHALDESDDATIQRFFEVAKQRRDSWCVQNSSPE